MFVSICKKLQYYKDLDIISLSLLTRNRQELMSFGKKIIKKIPPKIIKKYDIKLAETMVEAGSGAMPINSLESIGIVFNKTNSPAKAHGIQVHNGTGDLLFYDYRFYVLDFIYNSFDYFKCAFIIDAAHKRSNNIC